MDGNVTIQIDKVIKPTTDVGNLYTFSVWYVESAADTVRNRFTDMPDKKRIEKIVLAKRSLIGNGQAYNGNLVSNFKPFSGAGIAYFNEPGRVDPLGRQWWINPDDIEEKESYLKGIRAETLIRKLIDEAIAEYND